jgi:hypothetical protein
LAPSGRPSGRGTPHYRAVSEPAACHWVKNLVKEQRKQQRRRTNSKATNLTDTWFALLVGTGFPLASKRCSCAPQFHLTTKERAAS